MNDRNERSLPLAFVAAAFGALALQACSSGSGGSEVGNSVDAAPTARVQVLNGGETRTFREGSEVLLTGKDSEDADGPLLGWSWAQTAGPSVRLLELNSTSVSFTAPDVNAPTDLTFELTVEDSHELTANSSVDVTVVPAQDANKFLSLDVRGAAQNTFDTFKVVAALAEDASTGAMPAPFTLSTRAYLVYPPRSAPNADCSFDTTGFAAGIPDMVGDCRVELLEDLTPAALPGGGTGFQGEWPANVPTVTRPNGLTTAQLESEWWNTHYTLPVPRLDVADFNQQFVDSGDRNAMLDLYNAHRARIVLSFELTAPQNQQNATLILNDVVSAPIPTGGGTSKSGLSGPSHAKIVANDGSGLPTTSFVPLEEVLGGIAGRESAVTAEVYYRTVDPDGTRTTLNAWLEQAGFTSDGAGTLLPEAAAGEGEFAHAVYVNNYDLGFGRDMYTRTDEFGNVYAFVVNYATLEGAIRKSLPIVTVVMEYSPLNGPADPGDKFVKFFTYADDGTGDSQLVRSMNFDGRGERFTPGNCVACHGGVKPPGLGELEYLEFDDTNMACDESRRLHAACYAWPAEKADGTPVPNGDLNATFLPWDVDSLLFADTDPAITEAPVRFDGVSLTARLEQDYGDYSRAAQEEQIMKLNRAAYATYCDAAQEPDCASDAARRLVEHWYSDEDGNLFAASYDDSEAVPGWRNGEVVSTPTDNNPLATSTNPDTAEELYHTVYAKHCRMCHTNIAEPSLRFDNYQKFAALGGANNGLIENVVFERGVMPGARLTADRFWASFGDGSPAAAERLAQEFDIQPTDGRLDPRPIARVAGGGPVARQDTVRLSGRDSVFADSFDWSVAFQAPPELLSNPEVANFVPTLVGSSTRELSFAAAKPGTYTVDLVINEAGGVGVAAETLELVVANFAPQPPNIELLVPEGGSQTLSVLDRLNMLCAEAGCPEIFGDGPVSVSVDVAGWDASDGDLVLDDASTGTITLDATQPGPISASIPFTITDTDLEAAGALVDVTIEALQDPVANDDAASMDAQSTVTSTLDPPPPRERSIDVLANDAADPSAEPLTINSFTEPANGSVREEAGSLVYTPDIGFIGTDTFTYNAIDSNPTGSGTSNDAAVEVTVRRTVLSFSEVESAFRDFGCMSCHEVSGRDWRVYGQVEAQTSAPEDAINSRILVFPVTHNTNGATPQAGWNRSNADFRTVWTWIEEGALP